MIRKYTVMESNIGETQNKINQAITVANEVPSLVAHRDNANIHVTSGQKASWNGAVTDIGTKSSLLTTNKIDLVSAVNELFTNANNGKTAVSSAITAKGVSASPTDTFSVLAEKIGQINTGKKFATSELDVIKTLRITGLGFRPSIVLVKQGNTSENPWTSVPWATIYYCELLSINQGQYSNDNYVWVHNDRLTVNDSGFSVELPNETQNARPTKWIAIE